MSLLVSEYAYTDALKLIFCQNRDQRCISVNFLGWIQRCISIRPHENNLRYWKCVYYTWHEIFQRCISGNSLECIISNNIVLTLTFFYPNLYFRPFFIIKPFKSVINWSKHYIKKTHTIIKLNLKCTDHT